MQGIPLNQFSSGGASASGSAPPPPPPPPPAVAAPAASGGGAAAVFAELNRGEEVTKGLRKVDKSEMTHKNPNLRASSVVPATNNGAASAKRPTKPSKPAALSGKKPSKFALEGNKWTIVRRLLPSTHLIPNLLEKQEYYENEPSLIVDNVEIGHVVYIYGCKNTTIQVKGKVNAINLGSLFVFNVRGYTAHNIRSQLYQDLHSLRVRHLRSVRDKLAFVCTSNYGCSSDDPNRLNRFGSGIPVEGMPRGGDHYSEVQQHQRQSARRR